MSGRIFNIQGGRLVEMSEQAFDREDVFQSLLEDYPDLLAGDQIRSQSPRRWLLVKREMGIASEENTSDRWSLDHLFLDQDGIPTLIEVKRSTDTRIRREVVGQMLDYAANAVVHWSIDRVQSEFVANCEREGIDADLRLSEFLAAELDADQFWQKVKTNLQAGRIRLLFVADTIPPELRRIVEFLNVQMDPAEVLAVEIKHYVGEGIKTLVPRVIGQTSEAEARKAPGSSGERKQPLSMAELLAVADDRGVGALYSQLVGLLTPLFDKVTTTQSTITFYAKLAGYKTGAAVLSFTPIISSKDRGLRFGVYVDRVAEMLGILPQDVAAIIPECDLKNPNYGGGYRAGFVLRDVDFDQLISMLKSRRIGAVLPS